jgi:hypothetical protein
MLTKFVLYYGQGSYEAQSIQAFVTALHQMTSAVAEAMRQPAPDEPVMPTALPPATKPEVQAEVVAAVPKGKVVPPSKRVDAIAQSVASVAPRDPMRGKKDAKATVTTAPVKGKPARFK